MKPRAIGFVIVFLTISLFVLLLSPVVLDFGSIEWFVDEPNRGQTLLGCVAVGLAAIGTWLGRKRLLLTIPCVLVFLFLAAVNIPGAIPARAVAQRAACIINLGAIAKAKADWAKENGKSPTDVPSENDLYGTNKFLRQFPVCPRGGRYRIGAVSEEPQCSFAHKGHKLNANP